MAPPDMRAQLVPAPGSKVPVIRQPFDPSDELPFWARGRFRGDVCYDRTDGASDVPVDATAPKEMADLLREALRAVDAPAEQLARLGLN
jgi:hypothetical protein